MGVSVTPDAARGAALDMWEASRAYDRTHLPGDADLSTMAVVGMVARSRRFLRAAFALADDGYELEAMLARARSGLPLPVSAAQTTRISSAGAGQTAGAAAAAKPSAPGRCRLSRVIGCAIVWATVLIRPRSPNRVSAAVWWPILGRSVSRISASHAFHAG
jgi:hypothetical protein